MALIDTHQAVKKIKASGLKENQAEVITEIISNIDQHLATKGDIARLEAKIESNIEKLEDKLDNHIKWMMTISGAIFLLLLKTAFFN